MLNAAFKAARQNADKLDEKLVCEAIENILSSKEANSGKNKTKVTRREISEEEYNKMTKNN